MHLRNAVTKLMKNEGYGQGYRYPHNEKTDEKAKVKQTHLPKALEGRVFYEPKDSGLEKIIKERLSGGNTK